MDTTELDSRIKARGETLGRLVMKRVSRKIREHLPEARIVRLFKYENGDFALERVSGPSGKVLHRFVNSQDAVKPAVIFLDDVDAITSDLVLYAMVGRARLHSVRVPKYTGAVKAYAIYLRADA